jgi:hypothetical protein
VTVGTALCDLTHLGVFHLHQSIEAVLSIFDFHTTPFGRMVGEFRRRVFEKVARVTWRGRSCTVV